MMWMVGLILSCVAVLTTTFALKASIKANRISREQLLINDKFEKFERNINSRLSGLKIDTVQIEAAVYKIADDCGVDIANCRNCKYKCFCENSTEKNCDGYIRDFICGSHSAINMICEHYERDDIE
ncbi:hypothetical protein [Eubacterium sp.]|uniref:hypothetical protein n=1 Tax=Eubacterium sp. TaxID=142586 RepID=UPI002FC62648